MNTELNPSALETPIIVRRQSPRARRMTLKIDAAAGVAELVVPKGVSKAEADRFERKHRRWAAAHLAQLPPRRRFIDGLALPVLDDTLHVRFCPDAPRAAHRVFDELIVGGREEQVAVRVEAWLRETARANLLARVTEHARALSRRVASIRIADPRTRWGSCSHTGTMSFSWRLVLAPEAVLNYVAAHETAHLIEMNHSVRFWRLVKDLDPAFEGARDWLADNGQALHRYGG
jgi:predicted metal-dependent hydrolase